MPEKVTLKFAATRDGVLITAPGYNLSYYDIGRIRNQLTDFALITHAVRDGDSSVMAYSMGSDHMTLAEQVASKVKLFASLQVNLHSLKWLDNETNKYRLAVAPLRPTNPEKMQGFAEALVEMLNQIRQVKALLVKANGHYFQLNIDVSSKGLKLDLREKLPRVYLEVVDIKYCQARTRHTAEADFDAYLAIRFPA